MTRARITAAALATGCAAVLALPTPAQAAGSVHLYKIYYDSPGSDTGSNSSLNAEYVQIRNTKSTGVRLTGWTLKDNTGYTYKFGTYTLGAGKTVTIRTGKGTNTTANRYWGRTWYVWNNTSDKATLRTSAGTWIDSCSYNSSAYDSKSC